MCVCEYPNSKLLLLLAKGYTAYTGRFLQSVFSGGADRHKYYQLPILQQVLKPRDLKNCQP